MVEQILKFNTPFQGQDVSNDASFNNDLSHHHKVPSLLGDCDWNDITELIHKMDSQPNMTFIECMMAELHKNTILSMRRQMQKENLIMLASYKGYSFHKYPAKQFQEKASNYMKEADIYKLINDVNPKNPTVSQSCLKTIFKTLDTTLIKLLRSKAITDAQFVLMHPQKSIIRLSYLYFVPDIDESKEPVVPIMVCKNAPIFNISHFISNTLWSMLNEITGCKKLANSDQVAYMLEQYAKADYLQETTYFVTFNFHDVCTKFSHHKALQALEKFLETHRPQLQEIAKHLSNKTILQLVRLVLETQYFIYDKKLYQQIHGSSSGSLLTILLAFTYLLYGQSTSLINTILNNKTEIFARYRDDIFLTWNGSKEDFQTLFNGTIHQQQENPTIPSIKTMIGKTIHLLDLELNNDKGHLVTKIFRNPKTDEYELPSQYEYHTNQPSDLLKAALKHALYCSTNQKDFEAERRHIRLSHLFRGFSSEFIDQCIEEFKKKDVGIKSDLIHPFHTIPFETLRKHIMQLYEAGMALEKEEKTQKTNIIHVPYPDSWTQEMALKIKDDLLNMVEESTTNKEAFRDIQFDLIPRPETPLAINDYLLDKRPPLSMLILSSK
ncbi:unnamed protein product [Rotaria sp. Silwood2]|nr:unnamed protein product [Rotaria sp. Silwood2]CAF3104730.1 unnamed protein product [Rotaria sp. Silwood2]CAF4352482.1 unnamed protein product [Rotaria sp. Silwood2]